MDRSIRDELVSRLQELARGFVPADPLAEGTVLGALISDAHLSGVLGRAAFGGMKDSGHGRERSLHALDSYTQLKTTWISPA